MRREPRRLRGTLAAAALTLVGASLGLRAGTETTADEWQRAAIENARLRRQVELAAGKEFYLVLDPERSELRLMLQGVTLHAFRVSRLDLGVPERVFVARGSAENVHGRVWGPAELDPPHEDERIAVRIPDPGTPPEELEPPVPPPPAPVPPRYFVRFDGELTVEVRRSDVAEGAGGIVRGLVEGGRHRVSDALAVLRGDGPRLRLFLASNDAEALYRALPPGTKLLIL